jgi:Ser/Thr protein kinase RdoA (MazF antagonist)
MHPRLGEEVAAAFDLGSLGAEPEPVARGEQGRVWKLTTERGEFAVKELFVLQTEADAAMDVAYQEAVLSAGSVPMPRPVRRFDGDVLAGVGDLLVRVYEWVDLLPANLDLDPTLIGRTIAAIHRVRHEPAPPEHPWYTDPVGRAKWRELSRQLAASGAPFADAFAAEVPTLIELEDLLAPWPAGRLQNCHRDLWADNILPTPAGGVFVIDWENCGLADPGQEVAMALFDFGYRDAVAH